MEVANQLQFISSSRDVSDRVKRFISASSVAIIFFLAIAPTLTWAPFSKIVENLNIETALEIRRGGPILIPTLMSEPRVRKPPLTAWLTAAAINPLTVADMSSSDAATRESAWKNLAWQTRWPALLCAAATLGLRVPVEAWDPEGERLDADAHRERLRRLVFGGLPAGNGLCTLATDPRQLSEMIEVAGPVVAWT